MNTPTLELELQRRKSKSGKIVVTKEKVDPSKIAIIVVDMWNYYYCRTGKKRKEAMIPRMNRVLDEARSLGIQVVFLPTDVIQSYEGYPQRKTVLALPHHDLPEPIDFNPPWPRGGDECTCGPGPQCMVNYGWTAMDSSLKICDADLIVHGEQELYNLCKEQGITHLLYVGIAANNCELFKPGAIFSMTRYGLKCVLVRDLSEAETTYVPGRYTPDDGTAEVIAHIERYIVPTINIVAELRKVGYWQENWIVESVAITPWGHRFYDPVTVTLSTPRIEEAQIYYTLDGSEPTKKSILYTKPFMLKETTTLRTTAFRNERRISLISTADFLRLPPNPPIPDVYLSDLDPARAILGFPYEDKKKPNINRAIGNHNLKIRGRKYEKGLGVHAICELIYNLKPNYERFVALAGVDDEILGKDLGWFRAGYASVIFQVFVDGKLLSESPVMRIQDVPWAFNVKIPKESNQIRLLVKDSGNYPLSLFFSPQYTRLHDRWSFFNYMDHADWVNAGFIMKK